MKTVGIIGCSNGQSENNRDLIDSLITLFKTNHQDVIVGKYIYENERTSPLNGQQRAKELMNMYDHPEITDIYDISGGDMANEILDDLDFDKIKKSSKVFWGYSDLTTVLNAIYTKTGKESVLYQVKNLVYEDSSDCQRYRYNHQETLFNPQFQMIQGQSIKGIVVGGNIRCFLKLAGTPYFPDMTHKVLLIESLGGRAPQMITFLSQLKSMGVFDQISGILMGTFTTMEQEHITPDMVTLVKEFAGENIPIAKTNEIGHGHNSKAIWIGREVTLS